MSKVLSNEESMMPSLRDFFSVEYNFDILKEFINSRKPRANKLSFGLKFKSISKHSIKLSLVIP